MIPNSVLYKVVLLFSIVIHIEFINNIIEVEVRHSYIRCCLKKIVLKFINVAQFKMLLIYWSYVTDGETTLASILTFAKKVTTI